MKLLFFDIETTGFSRKLDYIIELAGVIYNTETKEEESIFHRYVKPNKRIPLHITEITGITNQMVQNEKSEKSVVSDFIDFINEHNPDQYVGHNLDVFDYLWLKEKSLFYGFSFPEKPTIDTLKIARKNKVKTTMLTEKGNPSYKQEGIAAAYGIKYDAHSAIADVKALIQIFEIIGSQEANEKKTMPIDRKKMGLKF